MKSHTKTSFASLLLLLIIFCGCKKQNQQKELRDFQQVNLVDNNGKYQATRSDPTLMNAWGLVFTPNGIAWVNSQAGHVSEVWDNMGNILRPAVNIPSPGGATGGNPTGIVFNFSKGFVLSDGAAANFLFVGVDGILSGWNGTAGPNALLVKDNSSTSAYTGLALAVNNGIDTFLYAANFRSGKIDVWDQTFTPHPLPFTDPDIPAGYSPFNIQPINGFLYVTYAKVGSDGKEEKGIGKGFVDIFNTDGSFVRRFASRGFLNAPWGIALAAPGFFEDEKNGDSNDQDGDDDGNKNDMDKKQNDNQPTVLIGNFGDGFINAFSTDGIFLGPLQAHNRPIVIDGLWALVFPPTTATAIDPGRLYFTAGPNNEQDGLFGYLIKQ